MAVFAARVALSALRLRMITSTPPSERVTAMPGPIIPEPTTAAFAIFFISVRSPVSGTAPRRGWSAAVASPLSCQMTSPALRSRTVFLPSRRVFALIPAIVEKYDQLIGWANNIVPVELLGDRLSQSPLPAGFEFHLDGQVGQSVCSGREKNRREQDRFSKHGPSFGANGSIGQHTSTRISEIFPFRHLLS